MARRIARNTRTLLASLAESDAEAPAVPAADAGAAHPVALSADFPRLMELDVAWIRPNPDQPRTVFDESALAALAASIRDHGLQQPVIVREEGRNRYLLVAGERRLKAHQLLGRPTIFAIVSDGNPDEIALIENLQRVDLDAVDLARSLQRLMDRHRYTQEAVGALIGCDKAQVSRRLSVLRLPEPILADYRAHSAAITPSMLAEVAQAATPAAQRRLWEKAKAGLTVRAVRAERRSGPEADALAALHLLGRSLVRMDRDLDAVQRNAGALQSEHRERLALLRQRIDRLLEG